MAGKATANTKGGKGAPAKGGKAPAKGAPAGGRPTPQTKGEGKSGAAPKRVDHFGNIKPEDVAPAPTPRLLERYRAEVVPALRKQFNYANPMQVPEIKTVVINIGLGEAVSNARALDAAVGDLEAIAGQKPTINRAKKSIAAFKLREGMPIGTSVTLRSARMYEFLDRLMNIGLARVRDFNGVSPKAFDGHGNYTLGLREQIIFPEIEYDKVDRVRGMEITIVTSANSDEEGRQLLRNLGMPFRTN